jgi:hypothetical protein
MTSDFLEGPQQISSLRLRPWVSHTLGRHGAQALVRAYAYPSGPVTGLPPSVPRPAGAR